MQDGKRATREACVRSTPGPVPKCQGDGAPLSPEGGGEELVGHAWSLSSQEPKTGVRSQPGHAARTRPAMDTQNTVSH